MAKPKPDGNRRLLYPLFIALTFCAGIVLAWGLQQWQQADSTSGTGVSAYGGDFTLATTTGSASLKDYRNQLVMIYFGFASCPDVCPTSLGIMKKAYNTLNTEEQAKVKGLFITIDPERDTTQTAQSYAQHFQENFQGLGGTLEAVTQVTKQYGVLYRKMETPGSALGYTMDHSSIIYLIDQQGILREKIQHGVTPGELTAKLRQYL